MKKRQIFGIFAGILLLVTGIFAVRFIRFTTEQTPPEVPIPQTRNLSGQNSKLSGPYTHKNLTIYLIHGSDVLKSKTPVPLEQALKRKLVVVHETEDINELAIENLSRNQEVYVQAGDIVKGGKQDRILTVDLIVPARSGRLPIDSFCVEQGRWTKRGVETLNLFESSSEYVSSRDMKVAAKVDKSQARVWGEVKKSQDKLSMATASNTASDISRSSLPLTLENPRVRADSSKYIRALAGIVKDTSDVIGFLFALNGEINSADTYGSNELFLKLWPKLLKASAIEAVAESYAEETKRPPNLKDIGIFLETSKYAPVGDKRSVTDRIKMITRETKKSVYLESLDRGTFLHGSYIMR